MALYIGILVFLIGAFYIGARIGRGKKRAKDEDFDRWMHESNRDPSCPHCMLGRMKK
jgi:hypothetical protein